MRLDCPICFADGSGDAPTGPSWPACGAPDEAAGKAPSGADLPEARSVEPESRPLLIPGPRSFSNVQGGRPRHDRETRRRQSPSDWCHEFAASGPSRRARPLRDIVRCGSGGERRHSVAAASWT